VPTLSDDVFFDAASGAATVTVSATANCANLDFTGFTGTFAGSSGINVYGTVITLGSGATYTNSGYLTLRNSGGTVTFTSNGKTTAFGITIAATFAPTLSLADAFSTSGLLIQEAGTLTTNNYSLSTTGYYSSYTTVRTVNLGSSTWTFTVSLNAFSVFNTNLTFNAGTSTLVFTAGGITNTSGASNGFSPGIAFYNVSFTSTVASTHNIVGGNTFNNLSVAAPSSVGVTQVAFDPRNTINGALTTTGTAGNRRVWFRSADNLARNIIVNGTPNLTDADFRDLHVTGAAAPIGGTRIGDLRGCSGIAFSTPKTVYWNLAGTQSWTANGWATTATGTPSTNNFPLAQDTAAFTNSGAGTGITIGDTSIPYMSGVDASGRTTSFTISATGTPNIHGDWKNGSGIGISSIYNFGFVGRNTQTITSAGKTFPSINIDSLGGTVQLADALNMGSSLSVTNGTFDTKGYAVTTTVLTSSNSNVRAITLGASTLTITGVGLTPVLNFDIDTNLTLNSGTSTLIITGGNVIVYTGGIVGGKVFYNISLTNATLVQWSNTLLCYCNNLTFSGPGFSTQIAVALGANITVTNAITAASTTGSSRLFFYSTSYAVPRVLTAGSFVGGDCDFRNITLAGGAAGTAITRAGDCGGNTGIVFPAPKTVYWNLAGSQIWNANAWCTSSGGTPNINNFPLPQDTAVIDNAGSAGTISFNNNANIGNISAGTRTNAVTLTGNILSTVWIHGSWTTGSGVTTTGSAGVNLSFIGRSTQTITSNGVAINFTVNLNGTASVVLGDALTLGSAYTLNVNSGGFDANNYNVSVGAFFVTSTSNLPTRMRSGTWTLTGTSTVFYVGSSVAFYKDTANIVVSNSTTSARSVSGGTGLALNKITLVGAGTSTFGINSTMQIDELASTKTVAHTIAFSPYTLTVGKWSVSGSAGNVVTVTGGTISVAGSRVSGVDYLAMGSTTISPTSPGEFYAGANSTGGTNVILTAAPAGTTRYWVGGTGTWDATTTTNWSASSGGAGGASVPTSADDVIFNSASSAGSYTVTCTATQLRCGYLSFSGPASGSVTWAGSGVLAIHDSLVLPATGLTRTYTGNIVASSNYTGRTITTNGVALGGSITINGVGSGWTLGSALSSSSNLLVNNGSFSTNNFAVTVGGLYSDSVNSTRTISLGASTITLNSGTLAFITATSYDLNFDAGTSTLVVGASTKAFNNAGKSCYNITLSSPATQSSLTSTLPTTCNNLTIQGMTSQNVNVVILSANFTVTGTLTITAGTNSSYRTFLRSDIIGTPRTLTANSFAAGAADIDFRDITIAGAAAPISGTRFGDCKGNSGITFPAGTTKYWNLAAGGNWWSTAWATSSGGVVSVDNIPLPQDTAIFEATGLNSGASVSLGTYNICKIDMSARTTNTMVLAQSLFSENSFYGDFISGSGVSYSGTGTTYRFVGRTTQNFKCAGATIVSQLIVESPGGSVVLQDAFSSAASSSIAMINGTFNANNYNVTLTSGSVASSVYTTNNTYPKTIAVGSGTWTIAGTGNGWDLTYTTEVTITGTGTIRFNSSSPKIFVGGGVSYSGITLDHGGAGTLTITGNNTFKDITSSYTATGANTLSLGTTTQRVTQFTGAGTSGKLFTILGTAASTPATLVLTTTPTTNVGYLTPQYVRGYYLTNPGNWFVGTNSLNNASLGFVFTPRPTPATSAGSSFLLFV
jgi:hypothetical protein